MQVIVQGLPTHYERQGSGKVILLLHGWADRLETFKSLTSDLGTKYTVLSMDLPGFGQTEAPKNAWNLNNYAQFVHDFLNKIDSENIYAIVGHSNGGALAIKAISDKKLDCQKLVLLASSGVRDQANIRRLAIKTVAKTGKIMTFWLPKITRQKLQKKLYGTVGSDMLVAPNLQETFKQTVRQDIQADAKKLHVPTLLIYGDQDRATPVDSVGVRLHDCINNSKLVIIHDADHFVHIAQPKQVLKVVQEFLS